MKLLSMFNTQLSEKNIKSWIEKNLIGEESDCRDFDLYSDWKNRESKFGVETVLYSSRIRESFVLAILDGEMPKAEFSYEKLLKTIEYCTGKRSCYWVHVTQPDNSWVDIVKIWEHSWLYSQTFQLENIEQLPAEEGGMSYLCLLAADKSWILSHELNPGNDFTIALHSSSELRDCILEKLDRTEVLDVRDN